MKAPDPASWFAAQWSEPTPGVIAGTSTRWAGASGGVFGDNNLSLTVGDCDEVVVANRQKLAEGLQAQVPAPKKAELPALQWLEQVHGNRCIYADQSSLGMTPQADAMWTDQVGLALAIQTADCVPILICDLAGARIGAAHAGWRGLLGNVIGELVSAMGVDPTQCLAWIGPCIGPEVFEVGSDVWQPVQALCSQAVFPHPDQNNKRMVDLTVLAAWQLTKLGLNKIGAARTCTYLNDDFYSHRQASVMRPEKPFTGRMASVICRFF